ncbi:sensor histidine kinase [Marinomonas flavescens]|uniref:sensor histidine kinase n=1 Tax=Marinomonas flavescens TaxID=2529379 RepID=UPI001056A315|nr:ATP-binding protein [Marinomonas flavescens]
MVKWFRKWLPTSKLQHWYVYGLLSLIVTITLLASSILLYSYNGNQATKQRIYEDSLWNALQFQLQSYRFLNYLVQIDKKDLPLNGAAYTQYDLLMSRVDLLRSGEVGYLIRGLTGGRTVRLLNIITGELELISLNLSKIEEGDLSYLQDMTTRLKQLDNQVNEFTILVSKGTNLYIARQRRALGENLENVRILMMCFLASLFVLCCCIAKGFSVFKINQRNNKQLLIDIQNIHEEKAKILTLVAQEARPQIQALLGVPCDNTESSNSIKESANELLHTINMFTDLALIDIKKLSLDITTESLQKNLDDYVQIFSSKLQRKGVTLVSYIDPALPDVIGLDFKRLKEIILELLLNAIKHTPEGSISINVRPSSLTPTQQPLNLENRRIGILQIAIKDTGFGLEHAIQDTLRASPTTQDNQPLILQNNIGLGLSLCYRLVHLMRGEIHFSSEATSGTEFWVDIPYEVSQSSPENISLYSCPDPKRALIFTTDNHLANALRLQLSSFNIEANRYLEGPYYDDEDLDLVIIMDSNLISPEIESNIKQWQKNGTFVLYDHQLTKDVQNKAYAAKAQSLSFPLTQSRLNGLIMDAFKTD